MFARDERVVFAKNGTERTGTVVDHPSSIVAVLPDPSNGHKEHWEWVPQHAVRALVPVTGRAT